MKQGWLKYTLHAGVLIGIGFAAAKYISGDELITALRQFNWLYALPIMALSTGYLLSKAWRFHLLLKPLTPLAWSVTTRAYIAGQTMTLLPGGIAARAGLLKQAGVPVGTSSAPIALSSLLDQVVFLLCTLLAALWFDQARKPLVIVMGVLIVISVLLGIQAVRRWLLGVIEWLLGKAKLLEQWRAFIMSIRDLFKPKLILYGMLLTLFAFVLNVEALNLALNGVGADAHYATLFLAFVLPTMLGRISALPAGVGVTEAGMVSILSTVPEVSFAQAVAAVAIFRLGTVLFTALLGAFVYFFGWRGPKEAVIT